MADTFQEYRDIAAKLGVDVLALVPGPNFVRLLGQAFHSNERPLVIFIPQSGAPAAVVPNLELGSFADVNFPGEVYDWRDQTGYDDAFRAVAAQMDAQSMAVEGQTMRVFVHHAIAQAWPGIRITDADAEIARPRQLKTADEVETLKKAIQVSERALISVLERVQVGQTEKQVESMLVQALLAQGADGMAFGPIVAAGTNSAKPHAHARDVAIVEGDALLFDFGANYGGFCADITRTVFVGHASERQRDIYETVLAANLKGHEVTRAGVTAHDIDDAVTSVLEASPYAAFIRHKTGHGLGRLVHEEPYIMRGNPVEMEAGMVFTNEPGLYDETAFGVRIEDDILVTEDGCESLTTFPKELMVVG